MNRELVGYAVRAEGLCDDGRVAGMTFQVLMRWIDQAENPWEYLGRVFWRVQAGLLSVHDDIDPKKLKWSVNGMFSVRPERTKLVRRQRVGGELTAAELAKLP